MEPMDYQTGHLTEWINKQTGLQHFQLQAMTGDASFRRYYRLHYPGGTWVVADASVEKERCQPFVAIAKALRNLGLQAPEIIAADLQQGFMLLTDFGEATYLKSLTHENADLLYTLALGALSKLQTCRDVSVPPFTRELMWQEITWYQEWFLQRYLQLSVDPWQASLHDCYQRIIDCAALQPQVFMHRDYHSANLMLIPAITAPAVGILDFQDAFIGPVTYDVVSLLRDCYVDWPEAQVQTWAINYWYQLRAMKVLTIDQAEFLRWFDWMGVERHLKALFTFSRKHVRDNTSHYLQYVPRTLNYLLDVSSRYSELTTLRQFIAEIVVPRFLEVKQPCVV